MTALILYSFYPTYWSSNCFVGHVAVVTGHFSVVGVKKSHPGGEVGGECSRVGISVATVTVKK